MVTLIGAGPGDAGLLTLKGAARIKTADVVLYDRYVSDEILAMIPDTAERINVGKSSGNHPVPQEEINRLLLEKALEGLTVIRLKGGDPYVFGRGGEELELLAANDISYEVVPGVTSAIAGAAYAGIPVTHREYASSFHVITGHGKNNEATSINYEALVNAKGTLIFMMGLAHIEEICSACITAGMEPNTPAAIVENATTPVQRRFIGTVSSLHEIALSNRVQSPVVIIIGEVCSLSDRYDWYGNKPLLGKHIVVARTKQGKLSDSLRELGCHVFETPLPEIVPLAFSPENALRYSWLVFTSVVGVNIFFDSLRNSEIDIRSLSHVKIACVGPETEKELINRGIIPSYCPATYNGAALARGLCEQVDKSERIYIARAKDGADSLTSILKENGYEFEDTPIYERIRVSKEMTIGRIDLAAFTSSSAVEQFAENVVKMDLSTIKAVCIGERTAATAKTYGMEVYISNESTINSMLDKIKELLV